jgi:hypothetical protein
MAEEAHVDFDGAPQFASDLRRLTDRLIVDDTDALLAVGRMLVPRVQSLMPKVSGALAGSVDANQVSPTEVEVSADTPYAAWVEFGGSRGRPLVSSGRFLFPTVERSGTTVKSRLEAQSQTTIGRFPWSRTS